MKTALLWIAATGHAIHGSSAQEAKPAHAPAPVFWGVVYGPFRENQSPTGGAGPTEDQIRADMPRLAAIGGRIRTYSVSGNQAKIPSIAQAYRLKTWIGAWIGPDLDHNEAEIQRLIAAAAQPSVEAVVIGNETLLRRDVTPEQLVAYIRNVKSRVAVPVAYSDIWHEMNEHPDVVRELDIVLAHIHPYWDAVPAEKGADYVLTRFQELQARYPDKKIVIGETGWPAGKKASAADGARQRRFWGDFLDVQRKHPEMRAFAYEAFDETFQADDIQWHWGFYNLDGSTKSHLLDLIPSQSADPARVAGAPGVILDRGAFLSPGFHLQCTTSRKINAWVATDEEGLLRCAYPGGQRWGSVVLTVGKAHEDVTDRKVMDCSAYACLVLDLKGERGGESLQIGVRTAREPSNGREPKYWVRNLTTNWQTLAIPLSAFVQDPDYPLDRLRQLHVVCELVFPGNSPETIYVRDVRFANEEVQAMPAHAMGMDGPILLVIGGTLLAWMLIRGGFALYLSRGDFKRVRLARQIAGRVLRDPMIAEQAALLLRASKKDDDPSRSQALLTLLRRDGPLLLQDPELAQGASEEINQHLRSLPATGDGAPRPGV